MKRYAIACFTLSLALCLCLILCAGCGKQAGPAETDAAAVGPNGKGDDPVQAALEPEMITYGGGLVSVSIKDGSVGIFFDYGLWDDLYGIYYSNPEFRDNIDWLQEGPFPVVGLDGRAVDACIAQIDGFPRSDFGDFIVPAVFLLMEDGSLQMTLANPNTWEYMGDEVSYESRRLPWLHDIVSLAYDVDSQSEYGEFMTVYAEDGRGQRYNLRIPGGYSFIMDKELYCPMPYIDEWAMNEGDYMTIALFGDGTAVHRKFWAHDELCEDYQGAYEVQLAENPDGDHPPAGAISFGLDLSWWIYEAGEGELSAEDAAFWDAGQTLGGVYLSYIIHDIHNEPAMYMTFLEGKGLVIYRDNRTPDEYLTFFSDKGTMTAEYGDDYDAVG